LDPIMKNIFFFSLFLINNIISSKSVEGHNSNTQKVKYTKVNLKGGNKRAKN